MDCPFCHAGQFTMRSHGFSRCVDKPKLANLLIYTVANECDKCGVQQATFTYGPFALLVAYVAGVWAVDRQALWDALDPLDPGASLEWGEPLSNVVLARGAS